MSEIKNALTPEEWVDALQRVRIDPAHDVDIDVAIGWVRYHKSSQHALAALALYNQPFGFTQADVELLRDLEDAPDDQRLAVEPLRKRIEALLPPESASLHLEKEIK